MDSQDVDRVEAATRLCKKWCNSPRRKVVDSRVYECHFGRGWTHPAHSVALKECERVLSLMRCDFIDYPAGTHPGVARRCDEWNEYLTDGVARFEALRDALTEAISQNRQRTSA